MADVTRFLEAIRKLDEGGLDLVGLITAGDTLAASGESELAVALYKLWLAANAEHPLRHIAAFNCGSQLLQAGKVVAAKEYLGRAIEANPDFYPARLNYASAFERAGDVDGAIGVWQEILDKLATLTQSHIATKVQTLKNIARVKRSAEVAETMLRQAIEIEPTQRDLVQHWVNRRQGRCVWPLLEPVGTLGVREILQRLAPLSMACFADDPLLQLATARAYSQQLGPAPGSLGVLGEWPRPGGKRPAKIRIGYLSSDFCHHAVGYLMSDVFENHDRSRFEISVFNIGERNDDAIQQKIMGQVDRWTDIRHVGDKAAAKLIIEQGTDILIDMNGHTNYQRTALLGMKPAPIIANWLGYPGTMGSDHHHYIIADEFLVPPELEPYYSEKVLRLPCYQPNGKLYSVPPVAASRADLGLPEKGVVYCCFNGSVKITEPVFTRWMVILASVPGSVIWLRGNPDDDFAGRLRLEAARRGIAPERLVFLPFRSNTEYLGCHRHADLFLDTFPYGAHTTASDALRMGVPIITLAGLGFASRVCGSLSRSAGLPDLVCDSPEKYVAWAVQLGNSPDLLAAVKAKLAAALPTCTLFNAPLLVKSLEQLFEEMHAEYRAGKLPRPHLDEALLADAVPPDAARVSSDFVSLAEYQRRRRLAEAARL